MPTPENELRAEYPHAFDEYGDPKPGYFYPREWWAKAYPDALARYQACALTANKQG